MICSHPALSRCNALCKMWESSLTQLSFIMKIKLCVVSVGVDLEAMLLSYSDDISSVENEEQRSEDTTLRYATKNSWPNRLGSGETDRLFCCWQMSESSQVPYHTNQKLHVDSQIEFYDPQCRMLLRGQGNLIVWPHLDQQLTKHQRQVWECSFR